MRGATANRPCRPRRHIGKSGPTHQPVEILASLRAMPDMLVLRPTDAIEAAECREFAPGSIRAAIEAAVRLGWDRYLGDDGGCIGMKGFGASGPADALYEHFGITPASAVAEVKRLHGAGKAGLP